MSIFLPEILLTTSLVAEVRRVLVRALRGCSPDGTASCHDRGWLQPDMA